MKKKIFFIIINIFLITQILYSSCNELKFLSFKDKNFQNFNYYFKKYIASYKGMLPENKGIIMLKNCIKIWEKIINNALKRKVNNNIIGKIIVIKSLLLQAQGLALQNKFEESKEISIKIRSEIYGLHKYLNLLTFEDFMIYFHNGILHRIEPLINQKRYFEIKFIIPLLKKTAKKFESPDFGVFNKKKYKKKYNELLLAIDNFINSVKFAITYVDPENGSFIINYRLNRNFNILHKRFGKLYLSFPEDLYK